MCIVLQDGQSYLLEKPLLFQVRLSPLNHDHDDPFHRKSWQNLMTRNITVHM